MLDILIAGGWMMIPLLVCSMIAVAVVLERGWYFYHIPATDKANQMIELVAHGKFDDALALNERQPHPVLQVLAAGIRERDAEPEKAMEATGIAAVRHMKRGMAALDTIITLAPLLGLLGTIIGMIDSFGIMAEQGMGQPHAVTGGVAEALICTATGILIAVIALIPYNYFLTRIEELTEHIEQYATRNESALHTSAGTNSQTLELSR